MRDLLGFWQWLIVGAFNIVVEHWYIPAGYAALYAVGAIIFLFTLRLSKNSNGVLVLERDSWAYRAAHPIDGARYVEQKRIKRTQEFHLNEAAPTITGNICAVFFRLFNMLLFVWPFLLVWLAGVLVIGSLGGLLVAGKAVTPTLAHLNDRAGDTHDVLIGKLQMPPLIAIILPSLVLVSLVFARSVLVGFLAKVAAVLMYAAPAVIVIALVVWLSYRLRGAESVGVVKEVLISVKTRACKLVEIR